MTHHIVIVGSMAFDDLEFPRPTPDPEAPSVLRTSFRDVIGGSATYSALAASSFAPVRVVAVVGGDFPEPMLERMRARGIDTDGVERVEGRTFRWSGRYHDNLVSRDTLDTQLNVFADFQPRLPQRYCDTQLCLLGNIHPALQLDVLEQVREPHLVIADTMNFWIRGATSELEALLRRIDMLVINDEEARELAGMHNLARAAKDILARGPSRLVVKRGEYGSLYFDDAGVFAAPALLLEDVADPTGAGDSFAGGLLGYLAQARALDHHTMRLAMLHGTAAASFCVEAVGPARLLEAGADDIARRVGQIRQLFSVAAP
jgi:sugar/nucleoside kinase (ribokinase family)